MKEKVIKLLNEVKERELYLYGKLENCLNQKENEYWLGKWHEVNIIRAELEKILNEEA